jgi:hypothetical protein
VGGFEHFDMYLIVKQFTLVKDHRPLEHLGAVHTKTLNRLMDTFNVMMDQMKSFAQSVPK